MKEKKRTTTHVFQSSWFFWHKPGWEPSAGVVTDAVWPRRGWAGGPAACWSRGWCCPSASCSHPSSTCSRCHNWNIDWTHLETFSETRWILYQKSLEMILHQGVSSLWWVLTILLTNIIDQPSIDRTTTKSCHYKLATTLTRHLRKTVFHQTWTNI